MQSDAAPDSPLQGFAKLVDEMVKDTVPRGDPRVVFDTVVTNINYGACGGGSPGPIVVTTRDGRVYTANHEVISTLPLGVLMKNHSTLFDPPVPRKQAELLSPASRFRMGNLTHVVVQFPVVWWDNGLVKWLSANKGSNTSAAGGPDGSGANAAGEFSLWHNLNHADFLPGSHTLLTFLGDPQSSVYEGMPDAAVQAALVARIKAQHPKLTIPQPSAFFISRHGYDRNSYGAYSISLVGWNDNDHDTLKAPLRACETDTVRVRLAGEAMCDDLNGCKKASTAKRAALPWFGVIAFGQCGWLFSVLFCPCFVLRNSIAILVAQMRSPVLLAPPPIHRSLC